MKTRLIALLAGFASAIAGAGGLPPSATYRDLPAQAFEDVKRQDEAQKDAVLQRQLRRDIAPTDFEQIIRH